MGKVRNGFAVVRFITLFLNEQKLLISGFKFFNGLFGEGGQDALRIRHQIHTLHIVVDSVSTQFDFLKVALDAVVILDMAQNNAHYLGMFNTLLRISRRDMVDID